MSSEPEAEQTESVQANESVEATEPEQEEMGNIEFDDEKPDPVAPSGGAERRKSYRLNKVLGATLRSNSGEEESTRLFIIDISSTGFRATNHSPLSEEEYEIEIALRKEEEPFRSSLRVVWFKELTVSGMFQMGCEFLEPDESESAKLEAFIDAEKNKMEKPRKSLDLGRPWTMI